MASLFHPAPVRLRPGHLSGIRTRLVVVPAAALAVSGILAGTFAGAASADPTPATGGDTVASVTAQLGDLAKRNEQLTEQFNAATIDVTAKQKAADAASAAATKAVADWKASIKTYGAAIVAQYKTGSMSKAGLLLSSSNTQDYLTTVATLKTVGDHDAAMITKLDAAHAKADQAKSAASTALTAATKQRDSLATEKSALQGQQDKYQALLASLTAAARAAYLAQDNAPAASRTATPASSSGGAAAAPAAPAVPVVAGSGAAQTALDFALSQRGKPYVWGAAGPGSYDCSGLTMAAYHAAGISLPHSAAGQYDYGTHVSLSALQPGDLVFWYSPIGHVAIYAGNGMIVHAPTSGDVVKLSPMFSGAVGATRLG